MTLPWEVKIDKMTDEEKLIHERRVRDTFEKWGHNSDEARIIVDGVKCGSTRVMVG